MRVLDARMLSLQRQGRIGFYGTATGQEAAVAGSAYALADTDWVFPALREIGVSMWRGTTVKEIVCQLIGNSGDVLIGRQMPCHFSDRRVRSVAWSSVIGTQLVHAMGAAWAAKLRRDRRGDDGIPRRRRVLGRRLPRRGRTSRASTGCRSCSSARTTSGRSRCRSRCRPRRSRSPSRRSPTAFPACASTATTCSP